MGFFKNPIHIAENEEISVIGMGQVDTTPVLDPDQLTANQLGLLRGLLKQLQDGTMKTEINGSLANEFEQLTIDATVAGIPLAPAKYTINTKAFITVETAPIRFRIDGVAPTATVGHLLNIGDSAELDSASNIANFKAIRTTGVSAVINCTYSV